MENKTLYQVVEDLKKQGYTEDFNLKQNCLECRGSKFEVLAHEFVVDEVYHFDDMDDPGEQSVLYAISSPVRKIKGILINGVGIYSEEITNEMADKLKVR